MKPAAVVVGVCVHGLAVVRALAREGVEVYALEKSDLVPGSYTRYAKIVRVVDINGYGLIGSLKELGEELKNQPKPVLFLSNDNMVSTVAKYWSEIEEYYHLSWANCTTKVQQLLLKSEVESFSVRSGLNYPSSRMIEEQEDIKKIPPSEYPVIVKPVKPLSSFKTFKTNSSENLSRFILSHKQDLPIVAQHWITGGDESLFFCALYLDEGKIITSFVGQKIESSPPAMGQSLIAKSTDSELLEKLTEQFFSGLNLSGFVSLEFKVDDTGKAWVIEPTVGRTDFWIDLPIQAGINFPYIEYCSVLKKNLSNMAKSYSNIIWFDTEKDRFCYIRLCAKKKTLKPFGAKPVFPFYGHRDMQPFFLALYLSSMRLLKSLFGRFKKLVSNEG